MAIDAGQWQAGLAALVVAAALGALVPRLVAAVPEPEPAPDDEPPENPKRLYAEIGASPGLAWKAAVASGVAAGLMGLVLGWDWRLLPLVALTPVGVALAVIDWQTTLLPTRLIAPSYVLTGVLVLLAAVLMQDRDVAIRGLVGWLAAFAFFLLLWFIYPRGMGYGDVRLSGVLGMVLGQVGYATLLVGIYAAFVIGGVGGLLLSVLRIVDRKRFPFGPFMLVGAVIGVVAGPGVAESLGW
ncbi:MAG TPA: A24 family peptidase [Marmoricola sp.]|jgi:leader peptidase (prepilin peptidase)/N-methyltransferase|nr:A24 family peptidase [Marmoricola sp.]